LPESHANADANEHADGHAYQHAHANQDQYPHGDPHVHANLDGQPDLYGQPHVYPNADAHADVDRHADSYVDADADAHQHGHGHCHRDGDQYANANRHRNGDRYEDRDAYRERHHHAVARDIDADHHGDSDGHSHRDPYCYGWPHADADDDSDTNVHTAGYCNVDAADHRNSDCLGVADAAGRYNDSVEPNYHRNAIYPDHVHTRHASDGYENIDSLPGHRDTHAYRHAHWRRNADQHTAWWWKSKPDAAPGDVDARRRRRHRDAWRRWYLHPDFSGLPGGLAAQHTNFSSSRWLAARWPR
jgi:hypothetical protein